MRAKLSSTLAGMALLECPFLFLVLGPVFNQRLPAPPLQYARPPLDKRCGNRLKEDALRCGFNDGLGAVLDVVLFAKKKRDDHSPFFCKPHGLRLFADAHDTQYDPRSLIRRDISGDAPGGISAPGFQPLSSCVSTKSQDNDAPHVSGHESER
jgi:hypothetical protein